MWPALDLLEQSHRCLLNDVRTTSSQLQKSDILTMTIEKIGVIMNTMRGACMLIRCTEILFSLEIKSLIHPFCLPEDDPSVSQRHLPGNTHI